MAHCVNEISRRQADFEKSLPAYMGCYDHDENDASQPCMPEVIYIAQVFRSDTRGHKAVNKPLNSYTTFRVGNEERNNRILQ